eukprot:TRINITY_DN19380_c0_g2_i1.p1 TRINITY_DN19380_c0_g2~~TRINITY_DN19380_c0_g2_i1.p1  ORF type:complete len:830 (-),score=70.83 TRINITY_DN19380_c0_g2_i1:132-2417(-)
MVIEPSREIYDTLVKTPLKQKLDSGGFHLECTEQGSLNAHFGHEWSLHPERTLWSVLKFSALHDPKHRDLHDGERSPISIVHFAGGCKKNISTQTSSPSENTVASQLISQWAKFRTDVYSVLEAARLFNVPGDTAAALSHRDVVGGKVSASLPSFFTLAPQKSGTTDIYSRLLSHPHIVSTTHKEQFFWTRLGNVTNLTASFLAYVANFNDLTQRKNFGMPYERLRLRSGDFTADYLYLDHTSPTLGKTPMERLDAWQPSAKFVVVLRDPANRLLSDYTYFSRCNPVRETPSGEQLHANVEETLLRFEKCLADSSAYLLPCAFQPYFNHAGCTTDLQWPHDGRPVVGAYDVFLSRWMKVFPRSQFFVTRLEDYDVGDPILMDALFAFLDVDSLPEDDPAFKQATVGKITLPHFNDFGENVTMLSKTRDLLRSFYSPHNQKLRAHLEDESLRWQEGRAHASLAFIKTHRTGSSTLANVVNRYVLKNDLRKMIPSDFVHLGHPFPGKDFHEPPLQQYDVLDNHAIMNVAAMSAYLKPTPFFFTVLRDPAAQWPSYWSYFVQGRCPQHENLSWIQRVRLAKVGVARGDEQAKDNACRGFTNIQSVDLGWYDSYGENGTQDANISSIYEFIEDLDKSLHDVIITEEMDRSLILFRRKVGWSLSDILYLSQHTHGSSNVLSRADMDAIRDINQVDSAVHKHYYANMLQAFASLGAQGEAELHALRRANDRLAKRCGNSASNFEEGSDCWAHLASSEDFTKFLAKKE